MADTAGVEPETSWSLVGRAFNWATEAGTWSGMALVPHKMINSLDLVGYGTGSSQVY